MLKLWTLLASVISLSWAATATSVAPTDHVRVSLLRASPGHLEHLIDEIKAQAGKDLILRHSQGDSWDLMIIGLQGRDQLATYSRDLKTPVDSDVTFSAECDLIRHGLTYFLHDQNTEQDLPAQFLLDQKEMTGTTSLFHIEMFQAAGGKYNDLLTQRHNENTYLTDTDRRANTICTVSAGSDVDVFTIGFYRDMAHFAEEPVMSDADLEKAALRAGFKNRADISFELRANIVGHHDTLATRVK